MAPAMHASSNGVLQSVASREAVRSRALEPISIHANYEDLLTDPAVDAVYICLANDQHAEWAIRSLEAGKHVLCEKPLALDAAQARLMAEAAHGADRLLVEAVWSRWHPRFRRLAELVQSGALGAIESIDAAFTFRGAIDGNYRNDPDRGGGALLDTGGYQVHSWVALTGGSARVSIDQATSTLAPSGVDLTTEVAAVLDGAIRATALSSFELDEHQLLCARGTNAAASMGTGPAFTAWRELTSLVVGQHEEVFAPVDAYQVMIEHVGGRIQGGDDWVVPLDESITVASLLDDVRAVATTR